MKKSLVAGLLAFLGVGLAIAHQTTTNEYGGRVLALEKIWNHAIEGKYVKAMDMLLADTMISVNIDGSVQSKKEFLASIESSIINHRRP